MKSISYLLIIITVAGYVSCSKGDKKDGNHDNNNNEDTLPYAPDKFCMGADLSYVNQVEDHGGVYSDSGKVADPFHIIRNHGANLVRVRLWHQPVWIRDVYGDPDMQLYSDLFDVERTIRRAKENGMVVNLDIHYSDFWADPGRQNPPAAWKDITQLSVLKDSVYRYTFRILKYYNDKGLMPEMVQVGNETNCGMLMTGLNAGFPDLNCCNGQWDNLGQVINEAIRAIREVDEVSTVNTQIVLHVADPKNMEWWFDNIRSKGGVTDFDVVGFSYYPLWHTTVPFDDLSMLVATVAEKYQKKVMIMETGYPWTTANADNYGNIQGGQSPLTGFPFTQQGQYDFLVSLTQKIITAGGHGVIYWEPAWITSQMKDSWGTGSSYDNCTLFDFSGNTIMGINFMNYKYQFP